MKKIQEGWHKINGEQIEDIEKYIFEQLASRSDMKIMIGTDSALRNISKVKKRIDYMTVIVFKKGNNGCHIIKRRDETLHNGFVPTAVKLNGEIAVTSTLALWMKEELNITPEIHLDVNPDFNAGSFQVYKYIKGYFESLGFESTFYKPEAAAAMCAADYFL